MRIVQEYLKECNRDELVNSYIYKHGFSAMEVMDPDMKDVTFGEYINNYKVAINKLIDKLITLEPVVKDKDRDILIAVHCSGKLLDENISFNLIKESDLYKDEPVTSYAYEFVPFEEAVGFYVADTYLTQYSLNDLLVDFIFEVSWTGFDQESKEEELKKIEDSFKEAMEHKDDEDYFISAEDMFKKFEEEHGFEFEKRDPAEKEAEKEMIAKDGEYNIFCMKLEIDKLKKLLEEEKEKASSEME